MVGTADKLIPPRQMDLLFENAINAPFKGMVTKHEKVG